MEAIEKLSETETISDKRPLETLELTTQGMALVKLYNEMAERGYERGDQQYIKPQDVYADFQLRKFRHIVRPRMETVDIKTVLDYGGGASDWSKLNFDPDSGMSAKDFFGVDEATVYEPARDLLVKKVSDCVICMDVLEHVFIADIPNVVRDLFSHAEKLLVVNVACYPAAALLPNGENAHITVRGPDWWKGIFDTISVDYPGVEVMLLCSETFVQGVAYEPYKAATWLSSTEFTTAQGFRTFGEGQQE